MIHGTISQRAQIMRIICISPGHTAREIDKYLVFSCHKRMSELRGDGFIQSDSMKICSVSGKLVMCWKPTKKGIARWG